MKKIFTLCAAAVIAASATAQTVTESKTFDNWYIGVNGGVATGIHPSQLGCGGSWAKDITLTLVSVSVATSLLFSVLQLRAMFILLTSITPVALVTTCSET